VSEVVAARRPRDWTTWLAPAVFGLTTLVALAAFVAAGHDVSDALTALLRGAFGTPDRFLSITLVRSVPLMLTGLAVALAFRAGVWNIGAEGQLYAGAAAAVTVGLTLDGAPAVLAIPLVMVAAALFGGAWALVPAFLRVRSGVNEVISTLLMNFVGIYFVAWLVHGPLQESRGVFPQSDPIAASARLPILLPDSRLHAGFLMALALAAALAWGFRRTAWGLRVRAVGSAPEAARVSGRIPPARVIWTTLVVSGVIAGLAGGVEVSGVTFALYENLSPGYGYTAIAVALLGGLRPWGVVIAAILFGALEAGASSMQRDASVPAVWVDVITALVILAVVAFSRRWRRG